MTLLLVLIAVVLVASFWARRAPAPPHQRAVPGGRKHRSGLEPYWLLGALVVGAVLLRFGLNAIVVAGGVVLAALRSLAPLLRLAPLFQSLRQGAPGARPSEPSEGAGGAASRPGRMSRREALQVLGLTEEATREDVQREYRRLMRKLHPDLGGSSYLAAKINEAKDVLS